MLGTALLGSVYAIAEEDRAGAVRELRRKVPDRHLPPPHRVGDHHPVGLRLARARRARRRRGQARRAGAVLVRPARPGPPDRQLRLRRRLRRPDVLPGHLRLRGRRGGWPGARRGRARRPQHRHHQGRVRRRPGRADPRPGPPDVRGRRADLVPRGGPAHACAARWPATCGSPTS